MTSCICLSHSSISVSATFSNSAVDALEWNEEERERRRRRQARAEERRQPVFLYIVMQLCQKESLRDWLRSCRLQRSRAKSLPMFRDVYYGLWGSIQGMDGLFHYVIDLAFVDSFVKYSI